MTGNGTVAMSNGIKTLESKYTREGKRNIHPPSGPIASVLWLETGETLIRPILELQSTVGLSHQHLNWLVCGVYKVEACNQTRRRVYKMHNLEGIDRQQTLGVH